MTNSILIGQWIDNVLRSNLSSYVEDRIWPLVAPFTKPEDFVCPFIIYTRNTINSRTYSKDGYVADEVTFQIDIISDKYINGITIANEVRNLFENHNFISNGMEIGDVRMTGINEDFSLQNSKYLQTLSFACNVNNA